MLGCLKQPIALLTVLLITLAILVSGCAPESVSQSASPHHVRSTFMARFARAMEQHPRQCLSIIVRTPPHPHPRPGTVEFRLLEQLGRDCFFLHDWQGVRATARQLEQWADHPVANVMHPQLIAHRATAAGFDGYGPSVLKLAYNLPAAPPPAAPEQTVAIVDAYGAPTVESDLAVYDQRYNLPACTQSNGCLSIVDQTGGSNLPPVDAGWAMETALDVETVHGLCPTCTILLVQASDASDGLDTGVATAERLGATEISLSWGGVDVYDATPPMYDVPGIAIVAASGDDGYGPGSPASFPEVVSVGGTSLTVAYGGTYGYESAWKGTGSGCATSLAARHWQTKLRSWARTGCGTHRAMNDVSADADPNSGAAVYDSTPVSWRGKTYQGWYIVGGTSLAAPIIASVFALAGGVAPHTYAPSVLYRWPHRHMFHDIRDGSVNGSCGNRMCRAQKGYDGPTGRGTPKGVGGFVSRTF